MILPIKRALASLSLLACAAGMADAAPSPQIQAFAAPLLGIDAPLRGCAGGLIVGVAADPFEAGLRCGAAYDSGLRTGGLRLELLLGLGDGLYAFAGGLVPFGTLSLPSPKADAQSARPAARLALRPAAWLCRFGLGSTLFELPWRFAKARLSLAAELAYTSYTVEADSLEKARESALAGATAFAAGVEALLALRLRWDFAAANANGAKNETP